MAAPGSVIIRAVFEARPAARLVAAVLAAALLLPACATRGPTVPEPDAGAASGAMADPAETLGGFVTAARERDFETVWGLLASPLRARYTPETLARDFSRVEQGALERLSRAGLEASAAPEVEGGRARFPIGDGRAVQLVLEADGWKVEALE